MERGITPKGAKLKPAVCACGHKGKSQRPEYYQCGSCYYDIRASAFEARAIKIESKIKKLLSDAKTYRKKAQAFRTRHHVTKALGKDLHLKLRMPQ